MNGEVRPVWRKLWSAVLLPLSRHRDAQPDLFCDLYRELAPRLTPLPDERLVVEAVNDPKVAMVQLRRTRSSQFAGEIAILDYLERVFIVAEEHGGEDLAAEYVALLSEFIRTYNLRYDLRPPCQLCPTLPGIFMSMMHDLHQAMAHDAHVGTILHEFEQAVLGLRSDRSPGHIKTCIQKQVNLLEAIGRANPGVKRGELAAIGKELGMFPHGSLGAALGNVYGFTSDYPGIRHSGTPGSALREISMRDFVAVSLLLAGFTPYLTNMIDADCIYRRT